MLLKMRLDTETVDFEEDEANKYCCKSPQVVSVKSHESWFKNNKKRLIVLFCVLCSITVLFFVMYGTYKNLIKYNLLCTDFF